MIDNKNYNLRFPVLNLIFNEYNFFLSGLRIQVSIHLHCKNTLQFSLPLI